VGNSDRGANTCNLRYRDQIKLCTFESWYGVNLAKTSANIGPEPTPCSLLSASASGRGSGPASGVWSHGHLVEDPMMAIGFRELLVLLSMVGTAVILGGAIWLVARFTGRSAAQRSQRPVAARLAELESLRQAGLISTDEYERQRASIISSV
jgi:hypothetical protein